jgi:hypothetical protein
MTEQRRLAAILVADVVGYSKRRIFGQCLLRSESDRIDAGS